MDLNLDVLVIPSNIVNNLDIQTNELTIFKSNDERNRIINSISNGLIYIPREDTLTKYAPVKIISIHTIIKLKNKDAYYILRKTDLPYKVTNTKNIRKNNIILGDVKYMYKNTLGYDNMFKKYEDYMSNNTKTKPVLKGIISLINSLSFIYLIEIDKKKQYKNNNKNLLYKYEWVSLDNLIDEYGQYYKTSRIIIDYLVNNKL